MIDHFKLLSSIGIKKKKRKKRNFFDVHDRCTNLRMTDVNFWLEISLNISNNLIYFFSSNLSFWF